MKNNTPIYIVIFLMFASGGYVNAWPAALDFSSDFGTGDGNKLSHSDEVDILRCDAESTYWEKNEVPETITPRSCHRYGLIWGGISEDVVLASNDALAAYNPNDAGTGWRLPTIKELVRLFNFSGNQVSEISFTNNGITDPVIATWLADVTDGYLISSTYRNISGNVNGDFNNEDLKHNQIFAIHIASGRVVALRLTSGVMRLCLGLDTTDGRCEEFESKKGSASKEYAKKDFYVLKVRTQTVNELGYE